MFLFRATLALALAAAAAASADQKQFDDFTVKFHRAYSTEDEYNTRSAIFSENLRRAEELTAASGGRTRHGVTRFMDLSPAEFDAMYTGFESSAVEEDALLPLDLLGGGVLPTAVDWRTKGVITAVKDQGTCAAGWAFSAIEQVESNWILDGNAAAELSPQELVDCDKGNNACSSGTTTNAYSFLKKAGVETEAAYPYTSGLALTDMRHLAVEDGSTHKCSYNKADVAASVTGYRFATTGANETQLQTTVANLGPVSVCLATGGWQTYTGGVVTAAACGTAVNHCAQVVGYNTGSSLGSYWIVRNSWGTSWGIQGYAYLALGTNTCDLTSVATYALVAKP